MVRQTAAGELEEERRAAIAKEVGVSEGMVRYYITKAKAAKVEKETDG